MPLYQSRGPAIKQTLLFGRQAPSRSRRPSHSPRFTRCSMLTQRRVKVTAGKETRLSVARLGSSMLSAKHTPPQHGFITDNKQRLD